MNIIRMS